MNQETNITDAAEKIASTPNTNREWLLKMADLEDGCEVGVGGMSWAEIMALFAGVKITFSRNCSSGILPTGERCECWRCRRERGEPLDGEIEQLAATQSALRRIASILPLLLLAAILPAAPIPTTTGDPCTFTPCQHWHTSYIPTGAGVYPLEVYTPSLPRVWPGPPIADIGDPPEPPVETPEPGTLWVAVVGTIFILVVGLLIRREDRKIAREQKRVDERFEAALRRVEQLRDALAHISSRSRDADSNAVARKALEEK